MGLTPAQARALAALRAFIEANGFPPTVNELRGDLGLASKASAHRMLEQLAERGHIRLTGEPRGIELVEPRAAA